MEGLERINNFIQEHGFDFHVLESDIDTSFQTRTTPSGRKIWFKLGLAGDVLTCSFADWRDVGVCHTVQSMEHLTDQQVTHINRFNKQAHIKRHAMTLNARLQVEELFEKWRRLALDANSDYLNQKKLKKSSGCLVVGSVEDNQQNLIIPMFDDAGELWNVQLISRSGKKTFHPKARTRGLFHEISGQTDRVFVGEGFATCLAINMHTHNKVYVAFSAKNLEEALLAAFARHGQEAVVLLADYDGKTYAKTGENPGMYACQRLSAKYRVSVAVPVDLDTTLERNVDFSDVWLDGNLGKLNLCTWEKLDQRSFKKAKVKPAKEDVIETTKVEFEPIVQPLRLAPPPVEGPKIYESSQAASGSPLRRLCTIDVKPVNFRLSDRPLPVVPVEFDKRGQPLLPHENNIVEMMRKYFDGFLVRCGKYLFMYTDTYWAECEDDDFLYRVIQTACGGFAKYRQLRDMISLFLKYVPQAPRDLFTPHPQVISFLNGTLTVLKINGKWEIVFREHRPDDYVTNIIPHHFDTTLEARNPVFEQVLKNLLGPDAETERAVCQMFGATLAPVFPRLFMLLGKPGTGKSTLILTAIKLVSEANVSSVLPSDFNNFLAEGMIGKLVNYDTDIPDNTPLQDSVLKKVEDRSPISINRKGQKVVRTCLPPVHIFGANQLPPTFERAVGAYKRRWTFIEFERFEAKDGDYNKEILDDVVQAGMAGVINFALRGLRDLLDSNGHYFMKEQAKERLVDWQRDNDSVEMFLDDARHGRLDGVKIAAGGLLKRSSLWSAYQMFLEEAYPNNRVRLHRNKFFQAVRDKGFAEDRSVKGYECFRGLVGPGGTQP